MPGAQERQPGDPNRPAVGKVGDEMQERADEASDDESAQEEGDDPMAPGRSATDDGDTDSDAVEPNEPG